MKELLPYVVVSIMLAVIFVPKQHLHRVMAWSLILSIAGGTAFFLHSFVT